MRRLINTETKKPVEYPVKALIITKNLWEHFIFDVPDIPKNSDQQFAFVMGYENEFGYVSLSELRPHVISVTKDLSEVMPPDGYQWAP